jgi:putative hemolysin
MFPSKTATSDAARTFMVRETVSSDRHPNDGRMLMPVDPFSFDLPSSLTGRAAAIIARPLLDLLGGFGRLRELYAALPPGPDETFPDRALEALAIDVSAAPSEVAQIPHAGPVIIAANHPRGALDGLVLAALMRRVRPDARLLANFVLSRIPEMRSLCFFVDPFEGARAEARSLGGLRAAHLWLRRGGALIMFPAGEVAHDRTEHATAEQPWSNTVGRLATATRAAIVPAFIEGENSRLFYAAGRVHPLLRTALLPRELLAARRSQVGVRFGRALAADTNPATLTTRAQEAAEGLSRRSQIVAADLSRRIGNAAKAEVARLAPEATLVNAGRFQVYCATAADVPVTLEEIGRLRAVSYRAAGEGTDADVDLDAFDHHYLHLFAWDHHEDRVVGAYRIGRTDRIINERGVAGLYTRTLFQYERELIDALSPALELGRSFVRPEYQRNYQALLLLWRGIGQFVVRNPEYRVLFGPVSISARYCDASHALLTAFLEQNHLDASLARMVVPVHPRPATTVPGAGAIPSDIAGAERLVTSLEPDGKGMPVLLRQYLKLNARALGFSVDPSFGHVVDALMAVDLPTVSPAILRRYFGQDGLAEYHRHHTSSRVAPAA